MPDGTYSYTLTTPVDGATANNGITTENNVETFTYQVTDANGNTTTSTITIDVIDDIPTANADTNSVVEGGIVDRQRADRRRDDVFGADGAATTVPAGGVVGVAAGSNTAVPVSGGVGRRGIPGSFGTLMLNANGSYTYDGIPNVVPPAGATDTFVYTIEDGDGDLSTTTLTITLTDSGLAASNDDHDGERGGAADRQQSVEHGGDGDRDGGGQRDARGCALQLCAAERPDVGTHGTLTFNAGRHLQLHADDAG